MNTLSLRHPGETRSYAQSLALSAFVHGLAIAFAVLYWAMSRIALPRTGEVLAERQNKIDGLLKRAEDLKTEAEEGAGAGDTGRGVARAWCGS